jgi:hypothetical protein
MTRSQRARSTLELLRESTRYHDINVFRVEFRRRFGGINPSDSTFYKKRRQVQFAGEQARSEAIAGDKTTVENPTNSKPTRRRNSALALSPDYATALEHACLVAELAQMSGGLDAIDLLLTVQDEVGGPAALSKIIAELRRFHGIEQIRRAVPQPATIDAATIPRYVPEDDEL